MKSKLITEFRINAVGIAIAVFLSFKTVARLLDAVVFLAIYHRLKFFMGK